MYYSFNTYLKERFGTRVQKLPLDAGLTCPNRDGTRGTGGCVYCDAYGSGTNAAKQNLTIGEQARSGMDFLSRRYKAKKFIAYFQSFCNTYAPVETLRAFFDEAVQMPEIVGLSVATRPDCLTSDVLKLLSQYSSRMMVWLELGLQSAVDETLIRINRGHTYREFLDGYLLAREYPLLICVHVIIGLPGENRSEILTTSNTIARLKPDGIKIHSLYIHRGTAIERLFLQGKYHPLQQHEFVGLACDMLELLPRETIIHRLTGDPRRQDLVAPEWTLQKNETLNLINAELLKRKNR